MIYMMQQIAPGPYKTAHYTIATALMGACMMLTGAISGYIQQAVGYQWFFVIVLLAAIPSIVVTLLAPFHQPDTAGPQSEEPAPRPPERTTMRYGHFDDENREYVITRPDTPLPWINYLGCEAYFGLISNTAGGYSFYRDARLRRLTRYRYNNAPFDLGGRYLYLRDNESGEFWSPSWQPTRTDARRLRVPARHGLHHHRLDLRRDRGRAPATSSRWARTWRSGS